MTGFCESVDYTQGWILGKSPRDPIFRDAVGHVREFRAQVLYCFVYELWTTLEPHLISFEASNMFFKIWSFQTQLWYDSFLVNSNVTSPLLTSHRFKWLFTVVVLATVLTKLCMTNCAVFFSFLKKLYCQCKMWAAFNCSASKVYKFLVFLCIYYALEFSS